MDDMLGITESCNCSPVCRWQCAGEDVRTDADTDAFWKANGHVAFHEVIETHQKELVQTVKEVEEVQNATSTTGGGAAGSLKRTLL